MSTRSSQTPAQSLTRNDRVVIHEDELPYLVDTVADMPHGGVRVTYSSGDTVEYAAGDQVAVVDGDLD
ncbi:hypothetical protein [Streptomyces xanthii]|uniref:Uncharacterized protein n=1 Tax=Streptomyces xanthii TaxID=2768069 RepID=A0A7H1BL25_9ACTN|nr:hypothetical protein [Streptomyces xanthii]QNS09430.1 hypothetical protein IAG42_37330 [Streptomyces xanthii]